MTISKIWPERFEIWTRGSSSFKGLIIAAKLSLTKFEASSSKSAFSSTKAASNCMKLEKVISVADFDFLKNFFEMLLGVMYG